MVRGGCERCGARTPNPRYCSGCEQIVYGEQRETDPSPDWTTLDDYPDCPECGGVAPNGGLCWACWSTKQDNDDDPDGMEVPT